MVDLAQLMENEVFMAFASHTMIVLLKMMFLSTANAFYRLSRKVFANPEDCHNKVSQIGQVKNRFFPIVLETKSPR
ncbi:microsomal glutathione S-transferase 1-like [Eptesicus fuscus]|uniref:microsomal glutathione S-transferase 1-like n=1 Tax=Eptesicus fuscus TaxID=29078 RepID=UPI0024043369|nr:microsomal glutathione S-transferase 1-like [Eptesicus fuscus]